MNSKRVLAAVAAGFFALVLTATPSSAIGNYVSAWSSTGSTTQLSCGAAERAQGPSWASMTTGGCRWMTYVRVQYVDQGNYYNSSWKTGDSVVGASYISVSPYSVVKHQVSY